MDYHKRNAITKDQYPLPRIDDILDTLGTARYVTSLAATGRLPWTILLARRLPLSPLETSKNSLFSRPVLLMLQQSSSGWWKLRSLVFSGIIAFFTLLIFWSVVRLFTSTCSRYFMSLNVFEQIASSSSSLNVNLDGSTCFLWHIVYKHGLSPDPAKFRVISNYPTPTNVAQFIGLAPYYRAVLWKVWVPWLPLDCIHP